MRINLRKNLYLKIFAVLLAVVCWFVVSSEVERVKDFQVPIDYVNLPGTVDMSGKVINTVAVRLRAPEPILRNVTGDQLSASIDLSSVPLGEQYIQVTAKMIKAPGGAEVTHIEPEMIPVHIEKRTRREVPVVAEFVGQPAKGHRRGKYAIEPPMVTIEGPASEVKRVKRATAGTISLEGETVDINIDVTPIPDAEPGSRVRVVTPDGPVHVHVPITPPNTSRKPVPDGDSSGRPS